MEFHILSDQLSKWSALFHSLRSQRTIFLLPFPHDNLRLYKRKNCVHTGERDFFDIDLNRICASVEYQNLRGEVQWQELHAYIAIT